jgi:type III restriction enzyme
MSEFTSPPFPLADALTAKTKALCQGIEQGHGEIFDLVTPTTAELLRWWFSEDMKASRSWMNFHAGQQQAILNTIVAHEVLGTPQLGAQSLLQLYQTEATAALLEGSLATQLSSKISGKTQSNHPKYCLKMATGTGKTWVLQALLVWQLLNKNAALSAGMDDARFTRQFLIIVPGLIVYERLLDALCGKTVESDVDGEATGKTVTRDFAQSDVAQYAELFIPAAHRDAVLGFVRGNVCKREEIGLKTTGNGVIAVCNWHVLVEAEEVNDDSEEDTIHADGVDLDPSEVARRVLPLAPGRATGNALDMLDKRYARGNVLAHLAALPELMVFNDEAHHIHAVKNGDRDAVRWQEALTTMAASKKSRFVQVDFSATPYVDAGTAKKPRKEYFPHIITDFDLKTAMRLGLVKSLVLDKRKELAALPLDFNAERDPSGKTVIGLSEGQRVMLRAGLHKLQKLEADFAGIDAKRRPKMLVVCEDTAVSPFVAEFVANELNDPQAAMTIDSGKKAELSDKEWAVVRGQLFNVDRHATPRVIVSVLMLREGFDVNNICVIVPLRASGAQILLEQTIGRGLRLMWRDSDYDDIKRENRALLKANKAPKSLIDVLSIVEHPMFNTFYADLMAEGLAGETDEDDDTTSGAGDMMTAHLRDDYAPLDFGIPFIVQEEEQFTEHREIDISSLPAFTAMTLAQLQTHLGKGDSFVSQDLQSSTLFGDYRVDGAVMNVNSYNDFLSRMTRRISQALSQPMKGNRVAQHAKIPYMQVNTAQLAGWLDDYIWTGLFAQAFNPLNPLNPVDTTAAHENWRILLLQAVQEHITKVFAEALLAAEQQWTHGATRVLYRQLSEVKSLPMRASNALELSKSMYTHTAYPTHSGGLEHTMMVWAQQDSEVAALCKIHEVRHDIARLRYVKEDGLPAFYVPDFLIRVGSPSNTKDEVSSTVYLVETKAQGQLSSPNVQRKLKAAMAWCERINGLVAEQRRHEIWYYVLLGESTVKQWQSGGKRCSELLSFSKLRNTWCNEQRKLV